MSDFGSQALPYQIRVIEGDLSVAPLQSGEAAGVIKLVGRALPERGLHEAVTQRISTTWNPGNPVATQQAIGVMIPNTTITGEWNDRYLGDGQAQALKALFKLICKRALSVEVSWGGALGGTTDNPTLSGEPSIRVGMIKRFEPINDRVQDLRWEMEFEWRSENEISTNQISATSQLNPREGFSNVINDIDLAISTWTAVQQGPTLKDVGLPQSVLQGLDQAFQALDTSIDAIQQASGTIVSAVVIPAAAAQQMIGACKNGVDAATLALSTVLSINLLAVEVRDSALDIIRLKDNFFTALGQFDVTTETCHDAGVGIGVNVSPDVIAVVRAPAGADLRDLSAQYYGTPDLWWLIANANDLDGSAVPAPPTGPSDDPSRPLVIPRPQAGTSSDLRQQC